MAQISLNDLIEALAGAVIDAQDRIEQHQMANLGAFFDEDNRPRSVLIRLPSQHPEAGENDEDLYRAPLLPLVSSNVLRIKDVEISFDAQLGELSELDEAALPASLAVPAAVDDWHPKPPALPGQIGVDLGSNAKSARHSAVHVVLRVEGSEPTEGVARLINRLAQSQGVFKTVKGD
ncbi:DUF2589 domain-containing protein [Xanthomonas arboricola]|uniref:DUF2589 domain-containing protein n=2 Tax=Xanthomonas arboricola TaxID=56448 RepID=UPI00069D77FF|nr:DUF2589 domain-containing protein [Xanthomonas arboricola]AKU50218.1 hypothetical protein AKJ12_10865 [Xanthomonas arboricola pv. juglandis]KOB03534.1 hypothetical protein AE921_02415 [Xanthomonas arboricola]KOB06917.1 hypothetical protein AE923_14230 [Xanthomonas arboricola]KOB09654.1 hypothetical protein AE922_07245 [Xanthomonas arboricola]KOB20728.1 hypothetical protein AE925_02535 [Xanthomonas arboricola]